MGRSSSFFTLMFLCLSVVSLTLFMKHLCEGTFGSRYKKQRASFYFAHAAVRSRTAGARQRSCLLRSPQIPSSAEGDAVCFLTLKAEDTHKK